MQASASCGPTTAAASVPSMTVEIARLASPAGTLSAAANRCCCWNARFTPSTSDAAHSRMKLEIDDRPGDDERGDGGEQDARDEGAAPAEALHGERRRDRGEREHRR